MDEYRSLQGRRSTASLLSAPSLAPRPGSASSSSSSAHDLMPPPSSMRLDTSVRRQHGYSSPSPSPYTSGGPSRHGRTETDFGLGSSAQSVTSSLHTIKPRASTSSLMSQSARSGRDSVSLGGKTASSRSRRLHDLVAATVPSTRGRRSDAADGSRLARDREAARGHLVEIASSLLDDGQAQQIPLSARDADRLLSNLKGKLRAQDPMNGSSTAIRLETTVAKLQRQPGMRDEMPALLEFFDHLAFGNNASSRISPPASLRARPEDIDGTEAKRQPMSQEDASDARLVPSLVERPHELANGPRSPLLDRINTPLPPISHETQNKKMDSGIARSSANGHPFSEDTHFLNDGSLSRAELLQKWRDAKGVATVSEVDLLRDILYLLQGINGQHVGFEEDVVLPSNEVGHAHDTDKVIKLTFYSDASQSISPPIRNLIHRIAELGRLYKRVDSFLTDQSQQGGSGMVMQSLCHFLSEEMTDYYRLIALLESKMKRPAGNSAGSIEAAAMGDDMSSLTLKRIAVWTEGVLLRMRLASTIIESCQDAHGGAIISLIHTYTFHGDPLIRSSTAAILEHVSKPFFHTLSKWIHEGELHDPFNEFFVELTENRASASSTLGEDSSHDPAERASSEHGALADPSSLWQRKFRFRAEMLPSFLDEGVGRKIFATGKSLHFIRFSCEDSDWTAARASMQEQSDLATLRYADLAGFERTIDSAYAVASSRLIEIFLSKFKLLEHLRALKDYLMLAQGDFVDLLMESIGPSLDRPAASLFRHNLTASLETAIRGSNSQYDDEDIVGRLDARILDFGEGDLGWDTFTLEYRVDEPVNTVLDNHAMMGYQVIFGHLWKVKRVEVALGGSWEELLIGANTLRRVLPRQCTRRRNMRQGRASAMGNAEQVDDGPTGNRAIVELANETLGQLKEQIHFVKQMQGYINLEVIEYSWNDLTQLFADHSCGRRRLDLDSLIQSHRAYLNTLLAKVLLRGTSSTREGKKSSEAQDHLAREVKSNLDTMLAFANACRDLSEFVTQHARRFDLQQLGVDESEDEGADAAHHSALEAVRARLTQHHEAFSRTTLYILSRLEKHSSLVVRDLATRINFNSYYHTSLVTGGAGTTGRRTPATQTA